MEISIENTTSSASFNRKGLKTLVRKQWVTLICLSIGNLGLASCSSLQAPFFPKEAEAKDTTPSQYGLVFGLFYLTTFIFSPIFGKIVQVVSPEFLRDFGMLVVGVCFILFGFLDKSPPGTTFLTLAYSIRILEGIGSAAFKTSNFAIIALVFPDHMATALGTIETMFGLGLIIGPTVGSALFEIGGFGLPFISSGIFLLIITAVTFFLLPKVDTGELQLTPSKSINFVKFLKNPLVLLYVSLLIWAPACLGFNLATLEPHLRQFNLTPIGVGFTFIVGGTFYALSSPVWGYLADKRINPKLLSLFSCVLLTLCYTFIGPSYIFSFDSQLWLVIVCLVMFGIGFGGTRVVAFVDCLNDAVNSGMTNNLTTSGVISGTFTASFAVGYFLGPTLGGIMLETLGYQMASSVFAVIMCLQGIAFVIFYILDLVKLKQKRKSKLIARILKSEMNLDSCIPSEEKHPLLASVPLENC